MKHNEYKALFEPSLSPMARNLYLALRYFADYETGVTSVSFRKLRELCSHEPPAKSKEQPIKPTKKQIEHQLSVLEKHGLVKKRSNGSAQQGIAPSWYLPKFGENNRAPIQGTMQTQQPRGLEGDQGTNTGHQEGTKRAPLQGTNGTQQPRDLEPDQGTNGNAQQGTISVYNSVNKNKYISADQFLSANDLEFGQEFKSVANMVGLQLNPEQLQAAFVQFTSHRNKRHLNQSKADWLADWRGWCAKAKVYEAGANNHAKPNTNTQRFSGFERPKNSTAKVLDLARAHAERYRSEDW